MKLSRILFSGLIIGTLIYLMTPRFLVTPGDTPLQMAITRAEGCNMGVAALIQENGREAASRMWLQTSNDDERYQLIREYLSFAPPTFDEFQDFQGEFLITLTPELNNDLKVAELFSIYPY